MGQFNMYSLYNTSIKPQEDNRTVNIWYTDTQTTHKTHNTELKKKSNVSCTLVI